ncbi:MAG: phosphatase PAP2 family protein, partial [Gammaproteobacteria bacterium]|nr:phosphatase PAP2 family protein [Gammaproteobacteria bacterium]
MLLKTQWPFIALLLISLLFVLFPELDLISSGWFYDPETKRFPLEGQAIVERPYEWVPLIGRGILILLLLTFVLSFRPIWRHWRKTTLFLFFCLIVGPGLIVNALFKENWARARPFEVTQFNGAMQFTRAWQITDQCPYNCSFISGHASAAFVLMAPAFLFVGWRRK